MKEAEQVIQVLAAHRLADQVFRTCLCNSSQSYCVFYVRMLDPSHRQSAQAFWYLHDKEMASNSC